MASPTPKPSPSVSSHFTPLLCVVDFHHARGPEISHWFGTSPAGSDPLEDKEDNSGWGLIPYMALPDGAHRGVEEFSYFSLVYHGDKNRKKDGGEGAGEEAGQEAGQELDILTDLDTKSYVVGSTNSLLIQQKDRYCDVLIDLDENLISILSPTLRSAVALSVADRRWIDFLAQQVTDTWDDTDPSRPKTHGYAGSEEFIRLQFEEYLLALLSAEKYHQHLSSHRDPNNKDRAAGGGGSDPKALLADIEGDPSSDFSPTFLDAWRQTENYALWSRTTGTHLFDLVDPRHPCAGGITIEDVQRRLAAQIAELHLDERFSATREVVGKRLVEGREQVGAAFGRVWADVEALREAQRRRAEEARVQAQAQAAAGEDGGEGKMGAQVLGLGGGRMPKPDLQQAQASVTAAGQRAGAYLSSWGSWAAEKRRAGWQRQVSGSQGATSTQEGKPKVIATNEVGRQDAHSGHETKEAG
ncbi:hypothetical protein LTR48_005356 [Friedmanniomyces endolithicus]|nr:hypothetical protein LTR48_005356 [Friedmanniomyces endolithicus]